MEYSSDLRFVNVDFVGVTSVKPFFPASCCAAIKSISLNIFEFESQSPATGILFCKCTCLYFHISIAKCLLFVIHIPISSPWLTFNSSKNCSQLVFFIFSSQVYYIEVTLRAELVILSENSDYEVWFVCLINCLHQSVSMSI